ncbi:girdin isoform X3 [Archocentrus centrarchus]|uniref:girdin isoform X3 n=1 Tax=Archocentrus centrarchus TaxID=63155 RepID=UPI0011E9CE17|nr:girdin-like isoform X3 [Archocentrus centrarchus]
MESGVFLPCLDQFMLSPLVTWVRTFVPNDGGMHLDFSELLDGVFLNDIMTQINPSAASQGANKVSKDPSQRIQNLNFLVQQIKTFYLDNLRQLIMTPLPNVLLLGRTPYSEQSLDEMKKLLLLLLGCAVQCEKKEEYIERIQTLDFETKAAIAVHIQEWTHSQENVLDLQWLDSSEVNPDEMEAVIRNMATHLRHLLDQRDAHLETIAELIQEKEGVVSVLNSPSSPQSASYSPSMQQHQVGTQQHLAVELADSKAKIRRLRQELEEKSEQMLDSRHELENMESELKRIQQENSLLLVDARAARTYRDELDALRERAIKADKLESEVGRYREQLHKMEFYKAKVEELKEDNRVLQETKEVLEDQLEGWRARSDKIHQLEKHNLLLKAQVHDMEQEREADRRRIEELQTENLALCLAQRRSMEESQHLGWELEQLSKTTENSQGQQTLSEEVSERACSRMLKLEKENKHLLKTIEELRASINNITQTKHSHQVVCSNNNCTSSTDESSVLQTSCSNVKNHTNGVSLSIVTEYMLNGDLNCHQELDTEELERVQSVNLLTDNPDLHIQEKGQLEDGDSGDHFKKRMSDLEVLENNHNRRHCFVRSRDHSPGSKNSSPCHESIFTGLPTRSSYASKHTQRLEAKCRALDTVNQHLQTSLDNTDRKVQRLEAEVEELEAENQSLQASLEELRISVRRLEQLETEKQTLEHETTALERDKRQLEKENRRLRQQAEIQEAKLDSSNVCMASLEREMRFLVKEVEGLRETAERVKGLERDNRELTKQAAIDQRTLATLREELVSEKLRNQQRDNDLEKLSHELEMKVLNQESTQQVEQETPDNSRFKMLESELETSLKKSLQIKDDKLASLEARLQESSSLNLQLRQELKSVKLSYEALQQRQEEERTTSGSPPPRETGKAMSEWLRESQEATKELLKLKDRLIEVERNNATLEAERQALQAQLKHLESQSDSQQAQILALQRQAASLQENNTALQTHNATLQVEKSTLNSQSASLMAQNTQLQQQQSKTESERDSAIHEREELRGAQEQLLRDHERLAVLHERQAMEYEALMGKHGCLKNAHRTLELEHRTLQDRYNSLLQQRTKLEDLEKALKEEQMRMALEKEQHRTTAAECCRLRDEKDWLNQTYRQLLNDNEVLTSDHKQLKSQLNEAKLEHTWLEADFSKLKKDYQQLDITCTKLTNQCELLSQLKGNLEEENRHLLNQIETLMLQNRTLLEQTMESKDLFHVEERQYIDKLNDLRRQKEKLEEKIMDQYKFYEPSPPRRRGNWITLKLKKLIKSNSREHGPERPPTPTHAGVAEPQLSCHDNSSFISSDGSGGSASTSACDAVSPQRNSNKDSNDSNLPSGLEDNDELQNHGLNCTKSRAQSESSVEFNLSLENEPWSNGSSPVQQLPSRRSSSSSYQAPSDTSTPQHTKQQHKEKTFTVATANSQILDIQCEPKQRDPVLSQDFWLRRGTKSIRRGPRGKAIRRASDSGGTSKTNPGLNGMNPKLSTSKAETTRASACSPITVLYVQGKSSSMSGCLNCFSSPLGKEGMRLKGPWSPKGLPRASSVISTAEGSSRRSSVNSDYKVIVKTDLLPVQVSEYSECNIQEGAASQNQQPETAINNSESEPIPPVKPPRDPAAVAPTDCPKSSVQESLFDTSFTFKSVFSNTIFSDSVVTTATSLDGFDNNQTILCPNPPLDQTCSLEISKSVENTPQTVLNMANEQSQNPEPAEGLEGKDEQLTIA